MNPKVDFYFDKAGQWREEAQHLRSLVLECGLNEELKWGVPCYNLNGKNIVLIHHFKNYCALLFFKGVLLSDPESILVQQTPNAQAVRQIRFTELQDVLEKSDILKSYIYEAINLEKAGVKPVTKRTDEFPVPDEWKAALQAEPTLKIAFEALTPGRQRAYLLHFAQPKQSQTRHMRIQKNKQRILDGKGLTD